ncbi:cupin domain-containing protein [Rhodococcoides trifolii]|nr:cupin domain-containing protein [Rhodococcus trifolii]
MRGPENRSALSRCISHDTKRFADEFWGRAPLLSRADELPTPFTDLLSVDAVDELVAERGVRTPFLRMAHEGSVLPRESYTASGGFGAEMPDQVDSAKALAEFAAGATMVLQGLHRLWPPLIRFSRDLVDDVGHPVQINAYVTPSSSRGFDPHYDVHDVFVLQVSGEKRWLIHPPVHEHPLSNQPWTDHRSAVERMAATEPTLDVVLREGDSLYIPKGWIHSATALGETSIHLTVGMAAFTRYDVALQMLKTWADDPAMRSPLPLGIDLTDVDAVAPHVLSTLDALGAVDTDPQAVAERIRSRFLDTTRPEPVRPLRTVATMASLTDADEVIWRHGSSARIVEGAGGVSVVLPGKTVTLPLVCAPAVRRLHEGKPARAGELDGLDADDSKVVVTRLLREGILVPGRKR